MKRLWAVGMLLLRASAANAGGFTFPDVGAEPMGRGGTFTAKADSPLALEYNVAGLAQQRHVGLVLFDANLVWSSFSFTRDGAYPDNPSSSMPYGGMSFPQVVDRGTSPTFIPFAGITFGFADRWTIGVASHLDPSVGDRNYAVASTSMSGWPSPARYDTNTLNWQVLHNTAAAAYHANDYLDVGAGIDVIWAVMQYGVNLFADQGRGACPTAESSPCDLPARVNVQGVNAAAVAGVMLRARPDLIFGANVRSATIINASGQANEGSMTGLPATMQTELPWTIRVGARYVCKEDKQEIMDLELDGTYESWGQAEGQGDKITIGSGATQLSWQTPRHYRDTYSIRLGGAYNFVFAPITVTPRLGGFYASSATKPTDTRLDFDTLEKFGLTVGLGLRITSARDLTINFAYTFIYEPDRHVQDGGISGTNSQTGNSVSSTGDLLPAVNNGVYSGGAHMFSLGIMLPLDNIWTKGN
jgi:long-subunit fatty acid transport protein